VALELIQSRIQMITRNIFCRVKAARA